MPIQEGETGRHGQLLERSDEQRCARMPGSKAEEGAHEK